MTGVQTCALPIFPTAIKADNRRHTPRCNRTAKGRRDRQPFIASHQVIELNHGRDTAHQVASHSAASTTQAIVSRAMPEVINKEVNVYASIKRYNITILKEA